MMKIVQYSTKIEILFYVILFTIFVGALNVKSRANTENVKSTNTPSKNNSEGKSLELSNKFMNSKEKQGFRYWPTDDLFWKEYQDLYQKEQIQNAIGFAWSQLQSFGDETPEGAEAYLAIAQSLFKKGYTYASFLILIDLAKDRIGTQVGIAALYELSLLAETSLYDKGSLTNFLNNHDFGNLHSDIRSFISYHKSLRNMTFGYNKWAKKYITQIDPTSHWSYLFQYWGAIGEVARDKIDSALPTLQSLQENTKVRPSLRNLASLQIARLEFEKGQFDTAYNIYSNIGHLGVREQGRIQLERAWAQYYTGNYSKALGLLSALRAPYFRPSLSPERFILEMLIFRELCHYNSVLNTAKRFQSTYRSAFKTIQKRTPLKNNKVLLSMSLMNKDIQDKANLIALIRREKAKFKEEKIAPNLIKKLMTQHKNADQRLQMEIDYQIEDHIRQIASELLEYRDEVSFLKYTATLDNLRIVRRGEGREYASESISTSTFDRIYWPVETRYGVIEYWTDEFEDYKMLISSRCYSEAPQKNPSSKELERRFK